MCCKRYWRTYERIRTAPRKDDSGNSVLMECCRYPFTLLSKTNIRQYSSKEQRLPPSSICSKKLRLWCSTNNHSNTNSQTSQLSRTSFFNYSVKPLSLAVSTLRIINPPRTIAPSLLLKYSKGVSHSSPARSPRPSAASLLTNHRLHTIRNHGSYRHDDHRCLHPFLSQPYFCRLVGCHLLPLLGHQGHKKLA